MNGARRWRWIAAASIVGIAMKRQQQSTDPTEASWRTRETVARQRRSEAIEVVWQRIERQLDRQSTGLAYVQVDPQGEVTAGAAESLTQTFSESRGIIPHELTLWVVGAQDRAALCQQLETWAVGGNLLLRQMRNS